MNFENIHSLLGIACKKENNKDLCAGINIAMHAIKYSSPKYQIRASIYIGGVMSTIVFNEKWTNDEARDVHNSLFNEIDKSLSEK